MQLFLINKRLSNEIKFKGYIMENNKTNENSCEAKCTCEKGECTTTYCKECCDCCKDNNCCSDNKCC